MAGIALRGWGKKGRTRVIGITSEYDRNNVLPPPFLLQNTISRVATGVWAQVASPSVWENQGQHVGSGGRLGKLFQIDVLPPSLDVLV